MKNNFIYRHIRKSSLIGIILSLVVLSVISLLFYFIPFNEVFYPDVLSYTYRASDKYSSGTEYVELTLNNVHYTGYDCYRRGRIYASYYYSLMQNSCTLILVNNRNGKLPDELNKYTITARLVKNDKLTDDVIDKMAKDLNWTTEGLRSITTDILIDETAYKYDIYLYLAIALGIIALIIMSYLISNIVYIIVPAVNPSCLYFRRLSRWKKNISNVNHELSSDIVIKSGNIMLTQNYIICTSLFNIEIIPINRIIWAYEHNTWQHFLWFKTKLNYTLSLLYGYRTHIDAVADSKEDIDSILRYLFNKAPGILIDYTPENKIAAKKRVKTILQRKSSKK